MQYPLTEVTRDPLILDMTKLILLATQTATFGEGPVATIPHQVPHPAKSMALVPQLNIIQQRFLQ